MELLVHALLSEDMFNLAVGFEKFHRAGLALGFETALKAPYLMHQVLAFSACHLAHARPERSSFYQHQAVTLQTRAVSTFNAARVHMDQSNCVSILLFSSMLAQHLLADTLAKRDQDGLDGFITHYMQCVGMHRGVYTVATSAWPLLMESEIEPILTLSKSFTDMSDDEKQACRTAIHYLQVRLDAVQADDTAQVSRYQMMTELLAAKRPQALIVLAHYAMLLHHGRHMWQVGNAGAYILDIIARYLGPEWD
ncbi:hypothetical protein EJ02DRAFT_502545 [Clathrospora elynae]|uniref:Transcription factor domain-containing protein n=1 Tax=Clathrospora elynae TaxID=706981 RepID=A0A6A5SRW2_9PLEO|nr:hypothetical protein EJ02DRAFT_502545 [Clathrospora elynae]